MTTLRAAVLAVSALACTPAWATTSVAPVATNSSQQIYMATDGASPTPNRWPAHLIWDGTTWATVNVDGGLTAHVSNWPTSYPVTGTFWQSVQPVSWSGQSVGITGSLPGFATTPTVNLGSTDNGNLQTIATAQGGPGTSITQPAGGSGLLGWLSGIFSRLAPPIHVTVDTGGNAILSNVTPSDAVTQVDGSPVWSQNALWDSVASKWFRWPGNAAGAKVQLPTNVSTTDCSGTITAGGTAQTMIAAQTALHGFMVANIDAVAGSGEVMGFSLTGTAAITAGIPQPGTWPIASPTATTYANLSSYTTPPGFGTSHAISIVAPTTGHKFSCTWW